MRNLDFAGQRNFLGGALAAVLALAGWQSSIAQEDESVEALYQGAAEKAMEGNFEEAVQKYERLFSLAGEFLGEDFGAAAGGIVFDYGNALVQLQQWEKARDAFKRCYEFKEKECKKAKKQTENSREKLALFQWGFCESMLGNNGEALKLYEQYIATNPPEEELKKVRNAYKLRYGTALVKAGRMEDGMNTITELFDKRVEWEVSPQFLMQGLLELGLGWVENAKAAQTPEALSEVEQKAQKFLDLNGAVLQVRPMEKFRFGFIERLKKLGYESSQAEMQTLALRFFSMAPTMEEVMNDIMGRVQQFPGAAVPAAYQEIINLVKAQQSKPMPPDLEMLRLVAGAWERLGNYLAPREIYRYLAEAYPNIEKGKLAEILHETARFSTMIGDYSSAEYFGSQFEEKIGKESELYNNVATFRLQSLFTARQYDAVTTICEGVRARFELGDQQRELADALYGLALYSLSRYKDAQEPLDEYVKTYKDTENREMVMYHRANNRLILGDFRTGAELMSEFIAEFPESEKFLDLALSDLALCRFNLEDYKAAVETVERLEQERPDSEALDRSLNVKGDSLLNLADRAAKGEEDLRKELEGKALQAYLKATESGKNALAGGKNEKMHKEAVAEAYAKAADLYVTAEDWDNAAKMYDAFFPDFVGTFWEPQISVYTMPALREKGRAEDGLKQLEKMINVMGNRPPEEQDIDLLRRAIGSYAEASVEARGEEVTAAAFDNFPGLDPANQALLTWLKMQKVIVLQDLRNKAERDSPEFAALQTRIDETFKQMEKFEIKNLSPFALKTIGDYFSGSDNPFLAVRYYEELLLRDTQEAQDLKASADLGLGRLEARRSDPESQKSARERFIRVTDVYGDKPLIPYGWLERGRVAMKLERWEEAKEAFATINKQKTWLNKVERAESNFAYAQCTEKLGDIAGAIEIYIVVWTNYGAYPNWASQAFEKYLELGLKDAESLQDPLELRTKKIEYYKWLQRKLFQWQNWADDDDPTGALRRLRRRLPELKSELAITPEEQQAIDFELGIG